MGSDLELEIASQSPSQTSLFNQWFQKPWWNRMHEKNDLKGGEQWTPWNPRKRNNGRSLHPSRGLESPFFRVTDRRTNRHRGGLENSRHCRHYGTFAKSMWPRARKTEDSGGHGWVEWLILGFFFKVDELVAYSFQNVWQLKKNVLGLVGVLHSTGFFQWKNLK